MGWTIFACFGCTKKRKRPKIGRRIQGYEALQSDIHKKQDVSESLSIPREKPTDDKKARIRKKVRFNLDVVTYEPLSSEEEDHGRDSNWEERGDKQAAAAGICLTSTDSNYRYNCYDGKDEYDDDDDDDDDDDECLISDDDDEEDDVYNHDSDDGCMFDLQKVYCEEITEDLRDCSSKPFISSATNTRIRSHYIVPVLNPIENLSQWKAIKTRKC